MTRPSPGQPAELSPGHRFTLALPVWTMRQVKSLLALYSTVTAVVVAAVADLYRKHYGDAEPPELVAGERMKRKGEE